jgi:hypothetical protein
MKFDTLVDKLAGLGAAGLVLLIAVAASGFAGGAAIVTALATLGGPLGMVGGIGMLGLVGVISQSVTRFGVDRIFHAVVARMKEQGTTEQEIRRKVKKMPISKSLKRDLFDKLG